MSKFFGFLRYKEHISGPTETVHAHLKDSKKHNAMVSFLMRQLKYEPCHEKICLGVCDQVWLKLAYLEIQAS